MAPHLVPTEQQSEAISLLSNESTKAALLGCDGGFGKTLVGAEVSRELGAKVILVIGPIKTKKQWQDTFKGQEIHLPFKNITSSAAGQQAWTDLSRHVPGVYFVGREFFALSATEKEPEQREDGTWTKGREARWSWSDVHPDVAIYDEVQAVSNRWSIGFAALKTLKCGYKVAMSATPAGNRFEGIWSVCRWLWPTQRNAQGNLYVDTSKWRWAAQWGKIEFDPYSGSNRKITGEANPGAFVASLPCYVRFEADRVPVQTIRARVELTPTQRKLYDEMEQDALTWLGENPLVADLPIVQKARMRQITLGEVTFNEAGEVDFADDCVSSKADACLKILARHPGESIVFFVDSQRFARVLAKRLPGAVEYSGKVTATERERIRTTFGSDEIKHIVATIPAVAEGLDGLQKVSHIEVWLNKSFNLMLNTQASFRLNRKGQTAQEIISYELIAPDTADDDHFASMVRQTLEMREVLKK